MKQAPATSLSSSKWLVEKHYRKHVLLLTNDCKEEDLDSDLKRQADKLGITQLTIVTDVEGISSSLSATTIASDTTIDTSPTSASTAPTSCASSEHGARVDVEPRLSPVTPTLSNELQKKRGVSVFRTGIRLMTGFGSRKRKAANVQSSSLAGVGSVLQGDHHHHIQLARDLGSRSRKSSMTGLPLISPSTLSVQSCEPWLSPSSVISSSTVSRADTFIDPEALRRSMECAEMMALRARQLEERTRFINYQASLIAQIRSERDKEKTTARLAHAAALEAQIIKKAVEDLESRQLENELKMVKEHASEKRAVMVRLRHMENYCQNPSPPPSPVEVTTSTLSRRNSERATSPLSPTRSSLDFEANMPLVPERKVTDKDYHSLASQYRERDAMDSLHTSKINVLRGQQKRQVENFTRKRDLELQKAATEQLKALDNIDRQYAVQEAECRAEFYVKRQALERRWKLQSTIERVQVEQLSGLRHEPLPAVTADDQGEGQPLLDTVVVTG